MKDYTKEFENYESTMAPPMDFRRKERERVTYYKSGRIKSVYLNSQTVISTDYGDIPCELITFYESGSIKRIFPRYGAISAYWSQKDEASLTPWMHLEQKDASFVIRPQVIHFYESGRLFSFTLFDHEKISVDTKYGSINTNIGVSFYETGEIRSLEPVFGTLIDLGDRVISPFNFLADHMHADHNSLVFDREGKIISYIGTEKRKRVCRTQMLTVAKTH